MRSLLSFKVQRPTTVRKLAETVGLFGQISLTELMDLLALAATPQRPFYLIAHRCNDLPTVASAVSKGANGIECDIQFTDHAVEFAVNHDYAWKPERDAIKPFLDGLAKIARDNPQVALVYFDLKDDDPDRAKRLREIIRTHLTDVVPVNVVISQASFDSRGFFLPIKSGLRPREAYTIDQDDDPARVSKFFLDNGVAQHGYGNGVFVAGVDVNINRSVMEAVALKWSNRKIRVVAVWTLAAQSSMRDFLAMGVDGILVNDINALKQVLGQPEVKKRVRLAKRLENPFTPPKQPGYVLTVKTGSIGHAGTDAHLTFQLHGPNGTVSTTIDAYPAGLFEKGSTNRVTLIGTDVGSVQELVVSQDGSGNAPDWWVDTVTVQKSGSSGSVPFVLDQWILPNRPVRRTPANVRYKVTVRTSGAVSGSGTDANVKLKLKGTNGEIEKEFDGGIGGRFENDASDTLYVDGIDLGKLTSIEVSHDGTGLGDDWHLARIVVKGAQIEANVPFDTWVKAGKPVIRSTAG